MNNIINLKKVIERRKLDKWEPDDGIREDKLYERIHELELLVTRLEGEIFFLMSLDGDGQSRIVSIKTIAEMVGARTGFDLHDFRSPRRPLPLCTARQIFMYMAHKHTKLSFPVIGRFIQKDHTTVIYGVNRIAARIKEEEWIRILVDDLSSELRQLAEG